METREIITIPIFLAIAAILFGTVFLTGVGTLANGTQGNACLNCQPTTVSLLNNLELFLVLGGMLAVVGLAVSALYFKRNK